MIKTIKIPSIPPGRFDAAHLVTADGTIWARVACESQPAHDTTALWDIRAWTAKHAPRKVVAIQFHPGLDQGWEEGIQRNAHGAGSYSTSFFRDHEYVMSIIA